MATNRQYDHEFKVQAIKLAQEIGQAKAAKELGISKNTMYTWFFFKQNTAYEITR